MPSRRNMMVGLGALTLGGGAVFGSGAFSSTEAQRSLDVNVVTGSDIADDFVDIVIDTSNDDSVTLLDESGTEISTPGSVFPEDPSNEYTQDPGFDGNAVSLMNTDATIVFGTGDYDGNQDLPANTTVTYDDLFYVVNDDGDTSDSFDVTFGLDGGDYDLSFDSPTMDSETVAAGSTTTVGKTILGTGSSDDANGTLTITVE